MVPHANEMTVAAMLDTTRAVLRDFSDTMAMIVGEIGMDKGV